MKNKMGGSCSTYRREGRTWLLWRNLRERAYLEDPDVLWEDNIKIDLE